MKQPPKTKIKIPDLKDSNLRDYFAGQALLGLLNQQNEQKRPVEETVEAAYRYADAMIRKRTK